MSKSTNLTNPLITMGFKIPLSLARKIEEEVHLRKCSKTDFFLELIEKYFEF